MTEDKSYIIGPPTKKKRQEPLYELCKTKQWKEVTSRATKHPEEAAIESRNRTTPLALACRFGAPIECVKALLDACPGKIRVSLPSRGTPLHEAIVHESTNQEVIRLLLQVDKNLDSSSTRATLLQDVDGHTPLHLLIRRKTPMHFQSGSGSNWKPLFEMLVQSCPEAVGIPDRGEYEEPPLVMAIKSNQYAAASTDYDYDSPNFPRIEMHIHEMVKTMLKYHPAASSKVLEGARGQYTALHSAVFHGRCSDTIQLLLQAEEQMSDQPKAALLGNTQGELPLHFAAMRGEPPRSIALLGSAAPMAVIARDSSGLTPLHWLWVRFVSTVLSLDDRQLTGTIELQPMAPTCQDPDEYSKYWHVERGYFSADLVLIRRIDPPLDFLRMRHIPPELYDKSLDRNMHWAERSFEVLSHIRERDREKTSLRIEWTREEIVHSLFWTKAVSLLRAFAKTQHADDREFYLAHTAMSFPTCPPAVAQITSLMFPQDLAIRDPDGLFPLHHAAKREWHAFDWRNEDDTAAVKLLRGESLILLKNAIRLSPPYVTRVTDSDGRLVLHHVIETFVAACSRNHIISTHKDVLSSMFSVIKDLLKLYPDSLERRDRQTMLYPFQQATAAATKHQSQPSLDEMPLSIVYTLFRENPLLVNTALV
mmetsp:Transcript_22894/g.26093  ORF Transcript_22894/g.26093 Transcript_22894/m.26093 type:complete len:649 (+) Transcript_22894:113-2059(+)|eukprot:CAMPEP_0194157212 /NCGR_PEP_ID=MMETSP0152-20130528/71160_1 /TAXON_ID=1049557 /ORGANISM="Thalassiothrix antarctica, Strain L6-D1" /LENGTH=648 /DNA_ID=CAMNT_0038865437 /DNA_START=23 /DNA_END=1969 /DNA_ORIENTATION=-